LDTETIPFGGGSPRAETSNEYRSQNPMPSMTISKNLSFIKKIRQKDLGLDSKAQLAPIHGINTS
jgi:hypothetical protein